MQNQVAEFISVLKKQGWTIGDIAARIGYSREHLSRQRTSKENHAAILHELKMTFPDAMPLIAAARISPGKSGEWTDTTPTEFIIENLIFIRAFLQSSLTIYAQIIAALPAPDRDRAQRELLALTAMVADQYQKERGKQTFRRHQKKMVTDGHHRTSAKRK